MYPFENIEIVKSTNIDLLVLNLCFFAENSDSSFLDWGEWSVPSEITLPGVSSKNLLLIEKVIFIFVK